VNIIFDYRSTHLALVISYKALTIQSLT